MVTPGSVDLFVCKTNTVNQLIFEPIYFRVFVFMDIFAAIYFRRLQSWTMQEQCTVYLYGHLRGNLFWRISFCRENQEIKLLAKMNWFTVMVLK